MARSFVLAPCPWLLFQCSFWSTILPLSCYASLTVVALVPRCTIIQHWILATDSILKRFFNSILNFLNLFFYSSALEKYFNSSHEETYTINYHIHFKKFWNISRTHPNSPKLDCCCNCILKTCIFKYAITAVFGKIKIISSLFPLISS